MWHMKEKGSSVGRIDLQLTDTRLGGEHIGNGEGEKFDFGHIMFGMLDVQEILSTWW